MSPLVTLLTLTVGVAFAALSAGCVHVRAYERTKLAHPTMTTLGEATVAADHMHDVQEGAAGGSSTGASGCGCN